jgi:O-acetyl-ADP-ribose deacetylase (regulator of RNase III)
LNFLIKNMTITYIEGDATRPVGEGKKVIPHIVNTKHRWGAGFVIALSDRWYAPEQSYRAMSKLVLGTVDFVPVEADIIVANMVGQEGTGLDENGLPPIRYDAVRTALIEVNDFAQAIGATIHAPRFGAGLAGGHWEEIEQIILEVVTVDVTIYDFKR